VALSVVWSLMVFAVISGEGNPVDKLAGLGSETTFHLRSQETVNVHRK